MMAVCKEFNSVDDPIASCTELTGIDKPTKPSFAGSRQCCLSSDELSYHNLWASTAEGVTQPTGQTGTKHLCSL